MCLSFCFLEWDFLFVRTLLWLNMWLVAVWVVYSPISDLIFQSRPVLADFSNTCFVLGETDQAFWPAFRSFSRANAGLRLLYSGTGPSQTRSKPAHLFFFDVYRKQRRFLLQTAHSNCQVQNLIPLSTDEIYSCLFSTFCFCQTQTPGPKVHTSDQPLGIRRAMRKRRDRS